MTQNFLIKSARILVKIIRILIDKSKSFVSFSFRTFSSIQVLYFLGENSLQEKTLIE